MNSDDHFTLKMVLIEPESNTEQNSLLIYSNSLLTTSKSGKMIKAVTFLNIGFNI